MQTMFDDIFAETVDLRSSWSVFISTVRRTLTGDGTVPHPYLGKRPSTFDSAISLLNLIDSLALGKTLFMNLSPTAPEIKATSAAASDYDDTENIDTSRDTSNQSEHTEQRHPFKSEKFSLETLSQHTTLIENLMKHELNLAGSNWFTRKFHRRRVLKSQKMLEHFKEVNFNSVHWLGEENTNDFEAITKLHVLCREFKTRYFIDLYELRKRFHNRDDWARNVSRLLSTAEKNVAWKLLSGSIEFQFTDELTYIIALFEGFDIAYQEGYELDEYIVSILSNCMPDDIKKDPLARKRLAFESSKLLYRLITKLKGMFAEGEEITGDEKKIVEVIIALSKIYNLSSDRYTVAGDEVLPFQRIFALIEEDEMVQKYISAFSKERNASYTGRRSEVFKPKCRIMPRISSLSEVEN